MPTIEDLEAENAKLRDKLSKLDDQNQLTTDENKQLEEENKHLGKELSSSVSRCLKKHWGEGRSFQSQEEEFETRHKERS